MQTSLGLLSVLPCEHQLRRRRDDFSFPTRLRFFLGRNHLLGLVMASSFILVVRSVCVHIEEGWDVWD